MTFPALYAIQCTVMISGPCFVALAPSWHSLPVHRGLGWVPSLSGRTATRFVNGEICCRKSFISFKVDKDDSPVVAVGMTVLRFFPPVLDVVCL